jgi:hypothetical protein
MKIESPAFTIADVRSFLETYSDRERNLLADRLQRVSNRLATVGPRVAAQPGDEGDWNPHELLAHLAGLSKYYGVLVHRVASGRPLDMELMQAVNMRDTAGQQLAQLDPSELVRMTLADHERTIKMLRSVDPAALRRSAQLADGISMTAEEIARMPLVSHLEMHLDDLEKMLNT